MVSNFYFKKENFTAYKFTAKTLKTSENLCEGERYGEQPVAASCSGFLVAPDVIMTAGHCVSEFKSCEEFKWVFGFEVPSSMVLPTSFNKEDVYECKSIIRESYGGSSFDYALIRLDRPTDRKPLELLAPGASAQPGDKLAMMGFPNGIPMKVVDRAVVKSIQQEGILVTDIDAFSGNSGSPVFDEKTGVVVGIMASGLNDYFFYRPKGCNVLNELSTLGADEKFTGLGVVPRDF
jgi:V8-like Glu-specific endopeptidase